MWVYIALLLQVVAAATSVRLDNWPVMSPDIAIATRSQRDLSRWAPIDQLTTFGISLNSLIFDKRGYKVDALDELSALLAVGAQTYMVDLYWNTFTDRWQLCPAPIPSNSTVWTGTLDPKIKWNGKRYLCDSKLTLDSVLSIMLSYIDTTNSNMEANFLQLLLNLKEIAPDISNSSIRTNTFSTVNSSTSNPSTSNPSDFVALGNSSLAESVAALGSYIFTPGDLIPLRNTSTSGAYYNSSDSRLPDLNTFLLNDYRRVLVNVLTDNSSQYNYTSADNSTLFFSTNLPTNVDQTSDRHDYSMCLSVLNATSDDNTNTDSTTNVFNNNSFTEHFRFVMDSTDVPFTNESYHNYIKCGRSPILNSAQYDVDAPDGTLNYSVGPIINSFIPLSFWSWAPSQPRSSPSDDDSDNLGGQQPNSTQKKSAETSTASGNVSEENLKNRCVALFPDGFRQDDCYQEYRYACRSIWHLHDWAIPRDSKKPYFETYKDNDCPHDYQFGVPGSAVELDSLQARIREDGYPYPIWIDLNDITVPDCFVSGGPYAKCPYQETVTRSELVRMIAPSFVVAVVILVLIFMEKLLRDVPIHTNRRRHWKKLIQEYNEKLDYEGVPS